MQPADLVYLHPNPYSGVFFVTDAGVGAADSKLQADESEVLPGLLYPHG